MDNNIKAKVEVDKTELDNVVAEIENAFPQIIFNGAIDSVYVNYTQNVFRGDE